MSRRLWTVAIAALMVTLAAGAFAVQGVAPRSHPASVAQTSASGMLSLQSVADAAAAQWNEDAVRIGVRATEGGPLDARVDPPFLYDTKADPIVGDGLAVVWTFAYVQPDAAHGLTFWVSVGGDGSLLYARELPDPWCCAYVEPVAVSVSHDGAVYHHEEPAHRPAPRAVSATIDAPQAMAAVAGDDAFATFPQDHPVFEAAFTLIPYEESGSAWAIEFHSAMGYAATAIVDADDGEVLHVNTWPNWRGPCCVTPEPPTPPDPPLPPEPCCRPEDFQGKFKGRAGGSSGSYDAHFPVESPDWLAAIRVEALLGETLLTDEYVLDIVDGHGRVISRTVGQAFLTAELAAAPTWGAYTARVYPRSAPTTETTVALIVDVTYLDAPVSMPRTFTFIGESWPGGEWWLHLGFEGQRPTFLSLQWERKVPTDNLELALIDEHQNEVETARGDDLALGVSAVALGVPDDATPWSYSAAIRQPSLPYVYGGQMLEWTLTVETLPWTWTPDPHCPHMHPGDVCH